MLWIEALFIVLALIGAICLILAFGAWLADRLPESWR